MPEIELVGKPAFPDENTAIGHRALRIEYMSDGNTAIGNRVIVTIVQAKKPSDEPAKVENTLIK